MGWHLHDSDCSTAALAVVIVNDVASWRQAHGVRVLIPSRGPYKPDTHFFSFEIRGKTGHSTLIQPEGHPVLDVPELAVVNA